MDGILEMVSRLPTLGCTFLGKVYQVYSLWKQPHIPFKCFSKFRKSWVVFSSLSQLAAHQKNLVLICMDTYL
jgi:hypothetical protein